MSQIVTTMAVSDILRRVRGSLDMNSSDWFAILAGKVSHAHFDNLVDAIDFEGFTLPIVLVERDFDEDDEEITYTLGNGHHRMCAAILLGLDEIPVVINDEGDYWAFEESHDKEWDAGDRSFEYWGLLSQNLPNGYFGDEGNEIHRDQFVNNDDDDTDRECNNCGGYVACDCCHVCEEEEACEHCGEYANGASSHRMGCREREFERVCCVVCFMRGDGFRFNCRCLPLSAAYAEHRARGYLPVGAWHPAGVLADAYAEDERWTRVQAQNAAESEWSDAVNAMRAAVMGGASAWVITHHAREVARTRDAYDALLNAL